MINRRWSPVLPWSRTDDLEAAGVNPESPVTFLVSVFTPKTKVP